MVPLGIFEIFEDPKGEIEELPSDFWIDVRSIGVAQRNVGVVFYPHGLEQVVVLGQFEDGVVFLAMAPATGFKTIVRCPTKSLRRESEYVHVSAHIDDIVGKPNCEDASADPGLRLQDLDVGVAVLDEARCSRNSRGSGPNHNDFLVRRRSS